MSDFKVCANCSKRVISHCTEPKCVEWREQVARGTIQECFAKLGSLAERLSRENISGTKEDYKEIKKVKKKVDELSKERNWENSLIKADLENLKNSCQDLTNEYISPKDQGIVDGGKFHIAPQVCCISQTIKIDKDSKYYCDYCWEDESPKFLNSLQNNLIDNFNKIYLEGKHFGFDFNSNSNYKKLRNGSFTNQEEIQQVYQELVKELKSEGIDIPNQNDKDNNPKHREREREREQIKQNIDNLTNKPHKTKAEEAELAGLRKKLAQLTKPTNNQTPGLSTGAKIGIGVVVISVLILIMALFFSKKSSKKYK